MCGIFGFSSGKSLLNDEIFQIKKDIETFTNLSLKRGSDAFGINIHFEIKITYLNQILILIFQLRAKVIIHLLMKNLTCFVKVEVLSIISVKQD